MTIHAKLSASGAHRWIACPGAPRLCEGIPSTSSPYAKEGTAAHALAETCLRTGESAQGLVGTTVHEFVVTQEMADAVDVYIGAVLDDYHLLGDAATLHVEDKFSLEWLGRPDMFGTADAVIRDPFGRLRVYDFKFGMGVAVEALDNPQMMFYGLGAAQDGTYEDVELIVVQPRAQHADGPVRRCLMPIEDLHAWGRDVLLPAALATEAPDAPLCPGGHCKFCPALAVCPAQREQAMVVAKNAFAPVPSLPAPDALAPADLRVVLEKADMIEAWFNSCREHAHRLLETGAATAEALGHKLVRGRATRKWKSDSAAETLLTSWLNQDAYTKKILSPAQAEKALKGKDVNLAPMVEEVRGIQLAPLSDKRPAVNGITFEEVNVE